MDIGQSPLTYIRLSVCPSVFFQSIFSKFELLRGGHDHSYAVIESQGHWSWSRVNVQRVWAW